MKNIAPVLLIFFNRADTLREVFEEVRKAKPGKLYLAQDGARENRHDDIENIKKCREIFDDIDWDCEVFTKYEDSNLGCGRGPEKALSWFFANEEEGIVLEDDCVPSPSFFGYCTELLERYRDDKRVFMITGLNSELQTRDVDTSYFFGYAGGNWGWATWRRSWEQMDYACEWVKDKKVLRGVKHTIASINKRAAKAEVRAFERTNKSVTDGVKISHWDVQFQAVRYLNHQLSIIPQKNQITNIGIGPTSTHCNAGKVPTKKFDKIGKINAFFNKNYDLGDELKHPEYMVENIDFDRRIYGSIYKPFYKVCIAKFKSLLRRIKKIIKKSEYR